MGVKEYHDKCCPGCGEDDKLYVDFTGRAKLTRNGTEDVGDHDWDGSSYMSCGHCSWSGEASEAEWDSDHPHWPTDDDEDEDEHEYDHDCQCDACTEYRDEIAANEPEPEPEGRIGLVHEHTLDDMRRAIERSGVLKSIDTTEGEDA